MTNEFHTYKATFGAGDCNYSYFISARTIEAARLHAVDLAQRNNVYLIDIHFIE